MNDEVTTVRILAPQDRGQQIIEDPVAYFEAARARAKALVERDMEREYGRRAPDYRGPFDPGAHSGL